MKRHPAFNCSSTELKKNWMCRPNVNMLIDTQAKHSSLTFSHITHTLRSTDSTVTDCSPIWRRSVMVQTHVSVYSRELGRGSPAGLSTSGLTELLERCQTCRTGQGYLIAALTLHQGSDRMWTHYILCAE